MKITKMTLRYSVELFNKSSIFKSHQKAVAALIPMILKGHVRLQRMRKSISSFWPLVRSSGSNRTGNTGKLFTLLNGRCGDRDSVVNEPLLDTSGVHADW